METKTKNNLIDIGLLLVGTALLAFSGIVPFYSTTALMLALPAFTVFGLRKNLIAGFLAMLVCSVVILVLRFDILTLYVLLPTLTGYVALVYVLKKLPFKKGAPLYFLAVVATCILTAVAMVLIMGKPADQIVADYVKDALKRNDRALINFVVKTFTEDFPSSHERMLEMYAAALRQDMADGLLFAVVSNVVIFCGTTYLFTKHLCAYLKISTHDKTPFEDYQLPNNYVWFVILPAFVIDFLALLTANAAVQAYVATLVFMSAIAPFAFFGVSFVSYLLGLIKNSKAKKGLRILNILVFFLCMQTALGFYIYAILGFADYLINTRNLIKKLF